MRAYKNVTIKPLILSDLNKRRTFAITVTKTLLNFCNDIVIIYLDETKRQIISDVLDYKCSKKRGKTF